MLNFITKKMRYSSLEEAGLPKYDDELKLGGWQPATQKLRISLDWRTCFLLACIPVTSVTTFVLSQRGSGSPAPTSISCARPPIRREWRMLDRAEKSSYIEAAKCLASVPSILRDNGTLNDDFPWVHKKPSTSGSASPAFVCDLLTMTSPSICTVFAVAPSLYSFL